MSKSAILKNLKPYQTPNPTTELPLRGISPVTGKIAKKKK